MWNCIQTRHGKTKTCRSRCACILTVLRTVLIIGIVSGAVLSASEYSATGPSEVEATSTSSKNSSQDDRPIPSPQTLVDMMLKDARTWANKGYFDAARSLVSRAQRHGVAPTSPELNPDQLLREIDDLELGVSQHAVQNPGIPSPAVETRENSPVANEESLGVLKTDDPITDATLQPWQVRQSSLAATGESRFMAGEGSGENDRVVPKLDGRPFETTALFYFAAGVFMCLVTAVPICLVVTRVTSGNGALFRIEIIRQRPADVGQYRVKTEQGYQESLDKARMPQVASRQNEPDERDNATNRPAISSFPSPTESSETAAASDEGAILRQIASMNRRLREAMVK